MFGICRQIRLSQKEEKARAGRLARTKFSPIG